MLEPSRLEAFCPTIWTMALEADRTRMKRAQDVALLSDQEVSWHAGLRDETEREQCFLDIWFKVLSGADAFNREHRRGPYAPGRR